MGKRCIVPGCKGNLAEELFRRRITENGHAWCPIIHERDNSVCGSDEEKVKQRFHVLPPSPGLRNVWLSLIGVDSNFTPSRNDSVCSAHFDLRGNRKVPTKNIPRNEEEIRRILEENARRMIEREAQKREAPSYRRSPGTPKIVDAFANVVAALDEEQSEIGDELDETVDLSTIFDKNAAPAVPDISDEQTSTIRPSFAESVDTANAGERTPPMIDENVIPMSPDSRERKVSWKRKSGSPRTPPSTSKRPCEKSSPDYRRGGHFDDSGDCIRVTCIVLRSEIAVLKTENESLKKDLNNCRTRLSIVETKQPSPCFECHRMREEIQILRQQVDELQDSFGFLRSDNRSTATRPVVDLETISEDRFFVITGIHLKAFRHVIKALEPIARRSTYWRGTKRTASRQKPVAAEEKAFDEYEQEFLLFLMRLRMNLNVELLGLIFRCSIGRVSEVFNTWLDIFSRQLGRLIQFPDQWTSWSLLPDQIAKKFPRLRCIIDCTEVEIQRPQSSYLQCLTYSQYKKRNTVKFLVAILGNGAVAFVSKAFCGRTSDKFIMNHCGLMDHLTPGDQVLADRGFSITDELLLRSIDLNTPPAGTGIVQFTSEQVYQTKKIANVRIHVERAIGRMKAYSILKGTLPITVLPVVDKIIMSVGILCNLQDELVK